MNESLSELGQKLVENSLLAEEFSAQRGLIDELFPYVYEASKRMSSRAISRWLESNGVKLSAATIAKALRKPESYWQELAEEIEPAARMVCKAYGVTAEFLLFDDAAAAELLATKTPCVECTTREFGSVAYDEIQEARAKLQEDWFTLPQAAKEACLGYADFDLEEIDAPAAVVTAKEETK
jgi:hypothetical protein